MCSSVTSSMLLIVPYITGLTQLYVIFAVMSVGITWASGPTLAKVVTSWFTKQRGVAFGILTGGGSAGGLVLVPAASAVLVLSGWQLAYQFLALSLLVAVIPVGFFLIRNRPVQSCRRIPTNTGDTLSQNSEMLGKSEEGPSDDYGIRQAINSSFFWKLAFGYFV